MVDHNVSVVEVPIQELDIPEVSTLLQLEEKLREVFEAGLPGFVIRASGIIESTASSHKEIADAIVATLNGHTDIAGRASISDGGGLDIPEIFKPGLGDLHQDCWVADDFVSEIRVHRTINGSGKVFLANHGTVPLSVHEERHKGDPNIWAVDYKADDLFASGLVDPELVNPTVYSTELAEGDTLVFLEEIPVRASHDKSGPVWHRFDTSTEYRSAYVMFVKYALAA
ncbi:MAG TPA: hypothetical protein VLG47_00190 [Candidatus Saccharimonadales bacterium]|nr:hypothetical protein [Candidatus Saccharimonadales bacterium]